MGRAAVRRVLYVKYKKDVGHKTTVTCAILIALTVILQLFGAFIHFGPFSITLVLVPIVIGAAMCGVWAGGLLGLVFGIVVLATDSAAFMAVNAFGTVVTVIAKGVLAGLAAAVVYKFTSKINSTLGVVLAALTCPVVNTGVFIIGCNLFFMDTLTQWGAELGFTSAGAYIVYGMVGGNFIFELITNMILSPVIVRLMNYRNK